MRGKHGNDQFRFSRCISQIVQKQHAMVRQRVAMDQCANVICRPLAHVQHIVTESPQRAHGLCNDIRVGKDTHTIRRRP
jgi:hypothetical protein